MMIDIPEGVTVNVSEGAVKISGRLGSNVRAYDSNLLSISVQGRKLSVEAIATGKRKKVADNSVASFAKELSNDINGVCNYYEKNLVTVFAHFPITIEEKNSTVYIKNLFGERSARTVKLIGNTKIEIKGQKLRLYGTSKDDVSQTAARLINKCRMPHKDTRVFQDGIYFEIE
ncbi:MAG: hypothetical protein QXD11_02685 [Candidatus Micrarchaeaceae archaeon]